MGGMFVAVGGTFVAVGGIFVAVGGTSVGGMSVGGTSVGGTSVGGTSVGGTLVGVGASSTHETPLTAKSVGIVPALPLPIKPKAAVPPLAPMVPFHCEAGLEALTDAPD